MYRAVLIFWLICIFALSVAKTLGEEAEEKFISACVLKFLETLGMTSTGDSIRIPSHKAGISAMVKHQEISELLKNLCPDVKVIEEPEPKETPNAPS